MMGREMKKGYLFLILCMFTHNALPDYFSGEALLKACEKPDPGDFFCLGFVTGTHDAVFEDMKEGASFHGYRFCTYKGISNHQLERVVIKYLNDHPENLHFAASSQVFAALAKAFPCE